MNGYTYNGWKCVQNNRIMFRVNFGCTLGIFHFNIYRFIWAILFTINRKDVEIVTFDRIVEGSVDVDASVDPSADTGSGSYNTDLNALNIALAKNQMAGMPINSYQISSV